MTISNLKILSIVLLCLQLCGCGGFFNKDNTPKPKPLVAFKASITPHRLWASGTPSSSTSSLKFNPTLYGGTIYTSGDNGVVSAISQNNGETQWSINTFLPLTSGPGVGNHIVVLGSRKGEVFALRSKNGAVLWQSHVSGEIIAKPVIHRDNVIIKTTSGILYALNVKNGHTIWSFKQTEPSLILNGASTPLLKNNALYVGYANGNLLKLDAVSGEVLWHREIATPEGAFSIERMIDIDADPVSSGYRVIAVTYQGKIAALDEENGDIIWSQPLSSYTGMAVHNQQVYVTDANSHVHAFDIDLGTTVWEQNALEARRITAPVVFNQYLVVGDREGYLHFLNQADGSFAARDFVGDAIIATPIVQNNVLYVETRRGYLAAYTL